MQHRSFPQSIQDECHHNQWHKVSHSHLAERTLPQQKRATNALLLHSVNVSSRASIRHHFSHAIPPFIELAAVGCSKVAPEEDGLAMSTMLEPVLASTLWASSSTLQPQDSGVVMPAQRRKLATGLCDTDSALDGGLEYGDITCISVDAESGARELLLAWLVSHLLVASDCVAYLIDSTLLFDIRRLHQRLTEALQSRGEQAAQSKAMETLARLKIMKMFDFIGLDECLAEVRDDVERPGVAFRLPTEHAPPTAPKGTISDSEDEGEDMLDDEPPPSPPRQPARKESGALEKFSEGRALLIIDNIAQVTAPLLKNNHAQGQALLTSFMCSLSHLTTARNICTVMLNNTTTHAQSKEHPPSIFSSCAATPTLGRTFSYLLDAHLLVHVVPKLAADARAIYDREQYGRQKQHLEMVSVVEVLQDRYGHGVGRWAPFSVDEEGRLKDMA